MAVAGYRSRPLAKAARRVAPIITVLPINHHSSATHHSSANPQEQLSTHRAVEPAVVALLKAVVHLRSLAETPPAAAPRAVPPSEGRSRLPALAGDIARLQSLLRAAAPAAGAGAAAAADLQALAEAVAALKALVDAPKAAGGPTTAEAEAEELKALVASVARLGALVAEGNIAVLK